MTPSRPSPSATSAFLSEVEKHELLVSHVKGTFAHDTFTQRMPSLIRAVADQNRSRLGTEQTTRLLQLADDLAQDAKIPLPEELPGPLGPTSSHWAELLRGKDYTWQHAPWFLAEHYMFHVVLILSGFYESDIDPFHISKVTELADAAAWRLLQSAAGPLDVSGSSPTAPPSRDPELLRRLIKLCLWGNKADGCYTKVKNTLQDVDATLAIEDKFLLVDHTEDVLRHLGALAATSSSDASPVCVQWINDNCGTELLLDLALADHLLTHSWCQSVVMNVKGEPMYISDATAVDVLEHIDAMVQSSRTPEVHSLGRRLQDHIRTQRLTTQSDLFWNKYTFYWEMPEELHRRLATDAALVIIKGDLNYRRLLGDRMWPATTPLATAVPYFPAPFVSLRTLKSNPMVGLSPEQEARLEEEDAHWRVNGVRGAIMGVLCRDT